MMPRRIVIGMKMSCLLGTGRGATAAAISRRRWRNSQTDWALYLYLSGVQRTFL